MITQSSPHTVYLCLLSVTVQQTMNISVTVKIVLCVALSV